MKKEEFIKLGLDENMANACLELFQKYTETASANIDFDIEALKKEHSKEITSLKINNAVDSAIIGFKGRNLKAIKSLINFDEIQIDEKGDISGLMPQLEKLVFEKETSFLFEKNKNEKDFKGVSPMSVDFKSTNITKEVFENMSYKEQLDLYNNNNELYNELTK
ncbi:MAG: phage scaffolding protein [Lachnospirales bacterium]